MNTPINTSSTVAGAMRLPFDPLIGAIGAPMRWAILAELSSGEPRMVKEIAITLRRSPTLISKHMGVLRRAGAVVCGRGGLYQIPPHFLVGVEKGHVDFGHCLLRLPPPAAAA